MQITNFWLDIEDGTGHRLGLGPLRPIHGFNNSKPLSASGEFSFEVAAADPNRSALLEKRTAICRYVDAAGVVRIFGGGIIDQIKAKIDTSGYLIYSVSGNDLARELSYRSVGLLSLASGSAGVTNGPAQIMALAPSGWVLWNGTTLNPVYAGFDGESVLSAFCRVGEHIGEHWRLGSGRQVIWLGPASAFPPSGVRAVQHVNDTVSVETVTGIAIISSLEEISDAADLLTRVIPRGTGNGSAIGTLAFATNSAPAGYTLDKVNNYLKRDDAESTYGRIEQVLDYKDLGPLSNTDLDLQNAANMLLQAAAEHLRQYGIPQKFYTVELAMVNQLLEPGTTIRVVYRQIIDGAVIYDLDGTFNIISVDQAIDETGLHTTKIEIATIDRLPMSDAEYLAGQAQEAKVFAAHQQLGPSVDNLSWRDELDSVHSASFRFWLGAEYTTIQRSLLRFRIQPLRSTVKSIGTSSTTTSAGGASSPTSSSGGSSTPTSSSGGGQTSSTGGSHQHFTSLPGGYGNTTVEWYASGGEIIPVTPSASGLSLPTGVSGSHTHTVDNHTHSVSVPAHTHSISVPDHTHTLTPTLNTEYGIFEESGANTLALADLAISLNGGGNLAGQVVDIGGGWYSLDLTAALVNSVYRPNQENNEVVISTAVANKTCRIEAQLTTRAVVQAVAYS
jgi:hypothetical protein